MDADVLPLRRIEGAAEEMSDEALIAACALGDRAALGALFDRHYESVRTFVAHLARGHDADIDDLVQITFETVQRSAGGFQGRSAVKTWILGVARNVARRNFRTRFRQHRLSLRLVAQPELPTEPIDERLAKHQEVERLRDAVATLSPALKEAFVLVYMQGLSGAEAAEALGVREGAIWKRLCTARKKIRAELEGQR